MAVVKIVVCIVVGILGFLVLVLGLIAESKRVKASNNFSTTNNNQSCSYDETPAAGLGIVAAVLVLVAQIIANAYGGCVCCCERNPGSRSNSKKICAILCLVFSWILALLSFLLLMVYGIANTRFTHDTTVTNGVVECPIPPTGGLASGAILGLIAAILGVMLCALAPSRRQQGLPHHGTAVEMPQYAGGAPNYYRNKY